MSGAMTAKKVKPLDLKKLRKDLQLIMDEIDRTQGVLPDYYSPVTWSRLQDTAERVANAIQAVRMKLSGTPAEEIAKKLGLGKQSVAAYLAWNTMLDPDWIKPEVARNSVACPLCNAVVGEECYGTSRTHKARIAAFRNSPAGKRYLQSKAQMMEDSYGVVSAKKAGVGT